MTRVATRLVPFLRDHWTAAILLVAASIAAAFFAVAMLTDFQRFNDTADRDRELRGWMTPRYVVMSYDLPRSVVADLLGLQAEDDRRLRLAEIAERRGLTLEELTQIVRDGAAAHRAGAQ